jgi:phosphoribosylformylglycinamidine synthase
VAVGGRTGRDGIHGATFSSLALEAGISASVVQIGNAITEKKAADAILRARELELYQSITDCGAGGFSSAVGEMAADCGAKVYLEKAPLKYSGLLPWEIWVSESQERMVLAVPKENLQELQEICRIEDAECSVIGEFAATKRLQVFHEGERVCDLDLEFLHDGIPRKKLKAVWTEAHKTEGLFTLSDAGLTSTLKNLLAHPNIGSKKWVVRQYDHEVQGGSVVKPFSGPTQTGPSDAAVCRPVLDSWRGVVVANGINPRYGEIDPYWMAANAIEEALRNLAAVGGDVEKAAILDNFCWGNVLDEEILGGLVRCSQGCYDFAVAFGTPFISGKDSLNNTWRDASGKISSIPGTLLVSAIGIIDDTRKCVTMDFKKPGNFLAFWVRQKMRWAVLTLILCRALWAGKCPKSAPRSL